MSTPTEIRPLPSSSSEAGSGTGKTGSTTATLPSGACCARLGLECIKGTGAGLACAITTGVVDADSLALTREVSLESLPMATTATITTMSPSFFIPPSQALPQKVRRTPSNTPTALQETLGHGQSSYQAHIQPVAAMAFSLKELESGPLIALRDPVGRCAIPCT